MKKTVLLFSLILLSICLFACQPSNDTPPEAVDICTEQGHDMAYTSNASMHIYKCQREGCNYTEQSGAHSGGKATCTEPAICSVCGVEYQKKTGHSFTAATCTAPGKCTVCGAIGEDQIAHKFVGATCITPGRCSICGEIGNDVTNIHKFAGATCTEQGACTVCGVKGGDLADHNYVGATCVEQGRCSVCGAVGGELSHDHVVSNEGGACALCGIDYVSATLEFALNDDKTGYIVTGIGSCLLEKIHIPSTYQQLPVVEIGEGAFIETSIEEIIIPDSVIKIGDYAFIDCYDLVCVTLSAELKIIGKWAFVGTPLTEIYLPDTIEVIDQFAFTGVYLESVTLPANLYEVGSDAFCGTMIKTVVFNDKLVNIGSSAFYGTLIEELKIPDSVKYIGNSAFSECYNLKTVRMGGVETIEECAFADCTALENVFVSENITAIHWRSFEGCTALRFNEYGGINYLGSTQKPYLVAVSYINGDEIALHDDTVFIMGRMLLNTDNVKSLYLGKSLRNIGNVALRGMDELVLSISSENEHFYVRDNCLISRESSRIIAIGKNAVIPNDGSVTYLNLAIYSYLSNVTSIVVPSGIKEMEVTLDNCKALQSIIIGKDVKKITVNSNDGNGNFSVYYQCTVYEKHKIDIQSTVVDTPILQIGYNQFMKDAEHYYYSESAPTEAGKFWHYVDGVPTPW